MTELEPESDRGLFVPALLAGLVAGAISSGIVTVSVLFGPGSSFAPVGGQVVTVLVHFLGTWVSNALWYVPYLVVVLLTVADPTRRTVTGGAIVVYGVDLLFTLGARQVLSVETTPATFAAPLASVVEYLAVATVVWLAYHEGYERLTGAVGDVRGHPLVAGKQLGPDLPLGRGLLAVALAALVGAVGLVLTGTVQALFQDLATSGAGSPGGSTAGGGTTTGISVSRLPVELVFQASFLLAVLFVTGFRVAVRDLLKGVALVVGVQSVVTLLSALVPPTQPVDLWSHRGPVLAPLPDAAAFVAIAIAVWLAFHDGMANVGGLSGSPGTDKAS